MVLGDELALGQYIMLRETNIDEVVKRTGYTFETCRLILDRAKARGETKVKLPLVPRELLELDVDEEVEDGAVSTETS